MHSQPSFADAEFSAKKRKTRREKFLEEMDQVVPWERLMGLIRPFYPTGRRGRPPIGIERMLRIYFLQQWYGLSDEGLEDTIYDSQAMRRFTRIDIGSETVPDATTLLNFRHLLEEHALTKTIFNEINAMLSERQLMMKEGTIVDATIIAAAPSTKNKAKERDPEMHQTKKGNQYYFGMKAHIGADMKSGLVHTVVTTAANVADITQTHKLLHGEESAVFTDAGYIGVEKRPEIVGAHAKVEFVVAEKRSKIKALPEGPLKNAKLALEKVKAQVRAFVEHPFHIIKNLFAYRKARYRGLAKNEAQLHTLFALSNLVIAKRDLLSLCRA
jgi:IS5 family transposase